MLLTFSVKQNQGVANFSQQGQPIKKQKSVFDIIKETDNKIKELNERLAKKIKKLCVVETADSPALDRGYISRIANMKQKNLSYRKVKELLYELERDFRRE